MVGIKIGLKLSLIIIVLLSSSFTGKAFVFTSASTNLEKTSNEYFASQNQLLSPWDYSWSDVSSYSFELNLSLLEKESYEGIGCWNLRLRASGDKSALPGYLFELRDLANDRIVSSILLTTSMQNNYSFSLWSTFGSPKEQLTSSNLSLIVSWSNSFIFREGAIFIEEVSLSFASFPEMNQDNYTPFFPNSTLFIALEALNTEVFFAITFWITSLFAWDNSSNMSKAELEVVYSLTPEKTGSFISKGSLSAYDMVNGEVQQNYLTNQDLLAGLNCSTSWNYQFIPQNLTLYFKIALQGTGNWFFKLNSINLKSRIIAPEDSEIVEDLLHQDSPLTLFFTIVFLFAPISIRLSFFKKKPVEEEEDITSEVILIEDR